jgi:N-acetylmuramoyl-L-alanine amidase
MISNKKVQQDTVLKKYIKHIEVNGVIEDNEVKKLIEIIIEGDAWISFAMFYKIQNTISKLNILEPSTKKLAKIFLIKGYHDYLRWVTNKNVMRILNIDYKVDHIPKNTAHNRRPGQLINVQYLTIHSTGNPSSSAKGERAWLTNNENQRTASFHVVVDEKQVIECIPFNEVAWHAGDGNGSGNKKSISLEICESGNRPITLKNAVVLSAKILRDNSLDITSLKRHHDWATKQCPRILIIPENRSNQLQTWDWFKNEVNKIL